MKYLSILAISLSSLSLVSADMLDRNFTINLLTRVEDMTISIPDLPDQVPIAWYNASIKHVYGDENSIYNTIGGLVFNETGRAQRYHIDTNQWSVNVGSFLSFTLVSSCARNMLILQIDLTLNDAAGFSHLDMAVSKDGSDGEGMRFDNLTPDVDGKWVSVSNDQKDKVDK